MLHLPAVLLGLRCIPNDSGFSPFTALTGTYLLTPNSYFKQGTPNTYMHDFVTSLNLLATNVDFTSLSAGVHHSRQPSYVSKNLRQSSHVFVRVDRVRCPQKHLTRQLSLIYAMLITLQCPAVTKAPILCS